MEKTLIWSGYAGLGPEMCLTVFSRCFFFFLKGICACVCCIRDRKALFVMNQDAARSGTTAAGGQSGEGF